MDEIIRELKTVRTDMEVSGDVGRFGRGRALLRALPGEAPAHARDRLRGRG